MSNYLDDTQKMMDDIFRESDNFDSLFLREARLSNRLLKSKLSGNFKKAKYFEDRLLFLKEKIKSTYV